MIAWWSCNAFIPTIAAGLANTVAAGRGLDRAATQALIESWKTTATASFNLGGLIGTLLTIPVAKHMGRKPMFAIYFALSAAAIFVAFGLEWPPEVRLYLYFFIGLSVFGVFGSFTFYLPELFPDPAARHRVGLLLQHRARLRLRGPVRGRGHRRARRGPGDDGHRVRRLGTAGRPAAGPVHYRDPGPSPR